MVVLGNAGACRTEAELYIPANAVGPVALVYETPRGWIVEGAEVGEPAAARIRKSAIDSAKQALSQYVNRMGQRAPAGLTGPGLSLWLMKKADGTAMDRPIG
jgi:hypothetical protein